MLRNSFARGPRAGAYDYHASVVAKRNVFILATWKKEGGGGNSAYVWVDHARWNADTPEKPLSPYCR